MYAHCLFCQRSLGENPVVEAFPYGRRLAFDSARGRLWVVCPRCRRWNLTPMEERWEAVEECERVFRETPRRFSTDNIGLARHASGLELIRVGDPREGEYAFWRYGAAFRRRWVKTVAVTGVAGAAMLLGNLGVLGGFGAGFVAVLGPAYLLRLPMTVGRGTKVRRTRYEVVSLRAVNMGLLEAPVLQPGAPFRLLINHPNGKIDLEGDEARDVLIRVLPTLNREGGRQVDVNAAVEAVANRGGPEGFADFLFRDAAWRTEASWAPPLSKKAKRSGLLVKMPTPLRLALEMSLNEAREADALRGELGALEAAWREAEELAAISDNLLLPKGWGAFRARHADITEPGA